MYFLHCTVWKTYTTIEVCTALSAQCNVFYSQVDTNYKLAHKTTSHSSHHCILFYLNTFRKQTMHAITWLTIMGVFFCNTTQVLRVSKNFQFLFIGTSNFAQLEKQLTCSSTMMIVILWCHCPPSIQSSASRPLHASMRVRAKTPQRPRVWQQMNRGKRGRTSVCLSHVSIWHA